MVKQTVVHPDHRIVRSNKNKLLRNTKLGKTLENYSSEKSKRIPIAVSLYKMFMN